jgi:cytochrome c oxidase assembly protein subunit 15
VKNTDSAQQTDAATASSFDSLALRSVRGLSLANIAAQIGIIVTGGTVRLTASGLGCSSWPQCEPGEFSPVFHAESTIHPYIEFGNRVLTGVLLVIAVLLAVAVWRARPRLTWWGIVPLLGVVAQAVLGGIVVILDLDPVLVGVHMFISAALVWFSVYLALRIRNAPRRDGAPITWLRRIFGLALILVITLGVLTTGSGPHSGDEHTNDRLGLDPEVIAKAHAASVWIFLALLAVLIWRVRNDRSIGERDEVRRAWVVLLAVTLIQGAIGYAQYFTGLPIVLVGLHMLGIGLLVAAQSAATYLLRDGRSASVSA